MRILIVGSSLGRGGAERAAANAARILSVRHRVSVFTFHRRMDYDPGTRVDSLDIPYDIDTPLRHKAGRFLAKLKGLRQEIGAHRPDLVMTFGDSASLICLANRVISSKPRVVTNTQAPPTKLYRGPIRPFYLGLLRALYPRADHSIAISSGVRAEITEKFGVRPDRATVIYNAVDLEEICGHQDADRDDLVEEIERIPCVLNVGRLAPQKNQALLIRAFRKVRDRTVARLVIAGVGPLEAELRALAADLGLEHDVLFAGWQPNPFRLMRKATVFALSSDYEGLGNVLVEAMATGCPVVATDCEFGPSEILQESECGILTPVGNEDELAAAITRVLQDDELRRTLSQKGRARAQAFSFESIGRAYDQLLADLAPGQTPSRESTDMSAA
jgi:glycosyltransferase involved in cell wall biosynthesis